MPADSELELNIDETVDGMIGDILPGSGTPAPADDAPTKEPAAPAITSLAKPAPVGAEGVVAEIPYPKSWKQELSPHWPKIPREVQDYVSNTREKDYLNGLEQYKTGHNSWSEMDAVIRPYMPRLTSINMQPAAAIRALLNADYALATGTPEQKYEMLASICQTYGLDPTKIRAGAAESPYQTDEAKALAKELAEMKGAMNGFLGSQVASQRAAIDKEVAAFATDPAHPHFDLVADHIARLISADKSLSLTDAYEAAVWANPTTRAKEMERVSKEKADKEQKDRLAALETARKAKAANLRGSPTARSTGAAKSGWEDELPKTAAAIAKRT